MIDRRLLGRLLLTVWMFMLVDRAVADEPAPAAAKPANQLGNKLPTEILGKYEGGKLVALRVGDRKAFVVEPTGAVDPQRRWLWDFPYWLAIDDAVGNLAHRFYVEKALAAGFHVAGVDVGASCASPAAAEVCQKFHDQLVAEYQLNKRARLLSHSHGGLIAYGYAIRHADCVDRIGGMCPAVDFCSYPGLPGVIAIPEKSLDYGLPLEELERRKAEFNPIDNLAPLAQAGVKIMHLHGTADTLIATEANAAELVRRYHELQGQAQVVYLADLPAAKRGHDGPELYNSPQLADFLVGDD